MPRSLLPPILAALLFLTAPLAAVEWASFESVARGYPVLRDHTGQKIADGEFVQWTEKGRLHVRITYSGRTRRVVEYSVFRQRPELIQDAWSLREHRNGQLYRSFDVDFRAGKANAKKQDEGALKTWSEDIEVQQGRAFAGFGFTLATRALRSQLLRGQPMELQAVGFSPKPRVVNVDVSYAGRDRIRMADRTLMGERYVVHPKLPWIADLFVNVPDAQIWLTSPPPATFLRWEGPLAEPSDPITRVDLLPGGSSEAAVPVATSGRR